MSVNKGEGCEIFFTIHPNFQMLAALMAVNVDVLQALKRAVKT